MKFKITCITSILAILLFYSCSNDGYSLGDFQVELATVEVVETGQYFLRLDDGSILRPSASNVSSFKPVNGKRVWVNYTKLADIGNPLGYYVRINNISYILTKDIIELTPENTDSIGNDPIKILSMWVGDNFLNIHFAYNIGEEKTHGINMIAKPTVNNIAQLEFRHNANGDPEKYGSTGYVAFDLRPYRDTHSDSINLSIKVKDFKEIKTYNIKYIFNNTANTTSSSKITEPNVIFQNRFE